MVNVGLRAALLGFVRETEDAIEHSGIHSLELTPIRPDAWNYLVDGPFVSAALQPKFRNSYRWCPGPSTPRVPASSIGDLGRLPIGHRIGL